MADLLERYGGVRRRSVDLAAPLSAEDCSAQSMPDASPVKWHLAHTTWFFETFVLARVEQPHAPFHPRFLYLFNSYYESVGAQYPRDRRGLLTRPSLDEVRRYREHVDAGVTRALERGDADEQVMSVIELGIHHEQQHQELIATDVKHLLWCNPLRPAYRAPLGTSGRVAPPLSWHAYPGGLLEIGHAGDGFAFDNERPRHRVFLEGWELASRPVSCGEYLEFIDDAGYARPELWLSGGWARVREEGWQAPLYWERGEDGWQQFSLAGMRAVEPGEPVCHVSLYEADAFARWAGARLPVEAEWESSAAGAAVEGNLAESGRLHPELAGSGSGARPAQLFGDVWEWTASAYGPYPGFRPLEGGLGEYNGKFMSSQNVLRGGSCATPGSHLRPGYRNFFYPPDRWQFSGVRLARDLR